MEDEPLLHFLRQHARDARLVTSVCTGALILGAARLLQGYRATTHWLSMDLLSLFGATRVDERVVVDGNRITAAGVTAGIDFGLEVARQLFGDEVAQEIQLMLQYSPAPTFRSGSPTTAPADLVDRVRKVRHRVQAERRAIAERAAGRLARYPSVE
jgi:cyclohexyl-isocyanide hydratase